MMNKKLSASIVVFLITIPVQVQAAPLTFFAETLHSLFSTVTKDSGVPHLKAGRPNGSHDKKPRSRTTHAENSIYEDANLGGKEIIIVKGHKISTRKKQDIDPNKKDSEGKTNCERMKSGKAPYANDGSKVELHHHKQEDVWTGEGASSGYLAELSEQEHRGNGNNSILHGNGRTPKSEKEGKQHNKFTRAYWMERAKEICA